ncbi:hypothetical protein [Bacillus sp. AFS073361]|nr:hypothetical protein [Bacillus sp. AFS073361]
MEGSKLLTQQKFQQLLFNTITMAQENEKIRVKEIIEEIKQQIISEKN